MQLLTVQIEGTDEAVIRKSNLLISQQKDFSSGSRCLFLFKAVHDLDAEKSVEATVLLILITMMTLQTQRMVPDLVNQ
jgi:hypothetical protein